MKNRDRYINQANELDLMIRIQTAIEGGYCQCAIEAVTNKSYPCDFMQVCSVETCKGCIKKWLDEGGHIAVIGDNKCVCCGAIIPEGIQVCPSCSRKAEETPEKLNKKQEEV